MFLTHSDLPLFQSKLPKVSSFGFFLLFSYSLIVKTIMACEKAGSTENCLNNQTCIYMKTVDRISTGSWIKTKPGHFWEYKNPSLKPLNSNNITKTLKFSIQAIYLSSHLYLYCAFNYTNCNKATAQYQNSVNNVKWRDLTLNLQAFHYWI